VDESDEALEVLDVIEGNHLEKARGKEDTTRQGMRGTPEEADNMEHAGKLLKGSHTVDEGTAVVEGLEEQHGW